MGLGAFLRQEWGGVAGIRCLSKLSPAPPPKKDGVFTPQIWSFEQVLPCRIKEYNAFKGGNSTFNARIEGAPWSTCAFYTLPACQRRNLRQALKAEIFGDGYWTNAAASYFLMASTSGRLATTVLHLVQYIMQMQSSSDLHTFAANPSWISPVCISRHYVTLCYNGVASNKEDQPSLAFPFLISMFESGTLWAHSIRKLTQPFCLNIKGP